MKEFISKYKKIIIFIFNNLLIFFINKNINICVIYSLLYLLLEIIEIKSFKIKEKELVKIRDNYLVNINTIIFINHLLILLIKSFIFLLKDQTDFLLMLTICPILFCRIVVLLFNNEYRYLKFFFTICEGKEYKERKIGKRKKHLFENLVNKIEVNEPKIKETTYQELKENLDKKISFNLKIINSLSFLMYFYLFKIVMEFYL